MNHVLSFVSVLLLSTSAHAGGVGWAYFSFADKTVRLNDNGAISVRTAKSISILGTSVGANTDNRASSWVRIRAVFADDTRFELNVRSLHPYVMGAMSGLQTSPKPKSIDVSCTNWNWTFYSKDDAGNLTAWVTLMEAAETSSESDHCSFGVAR